MSNLLCIIQKRSEARMVVVKATRSKIMTVNHIFPELIGRQLAVVCGSIMPPDPKFIVLQGRRDREGWFNPPFEPHD
jgi:hypothetical protein